MAAAASAAVPLDKVSIADVFRNLDVNAQNGLTSAEAQARAAKYGPNAIEEKKRSPWAMFLAYFWGVPRHNPKRTRSSAYSRVR
jgi:H+-transporting ATPase